MAWTAGFRARQFVRQSLWVVPLIGGVIGAVLADIDLWIEDRITLPPEWSYSADTANSVLSAAAAAMVGLIGFVVTIGVLVVQMATGTLSPASCGCGTGTGCRSSSSRRSRPLHLLFALLRHVESDSVPDLGITLVGLAVGIDLILLLLYFDRFVHALRPVAVAAAMAHAGLAIAAAETASRRRRARATTGRARSAGRAGPGAPLGRHPGRRHRGPRPVRGGPRPGLRHYRTRSVTSSPRGAC